MIRNIIFSIFFFLGIIIISLIFLPAFFLPKKIVLIGGRLMGYWTGFCLKVFLSTKITIKGKENMVTNEKFFIAASHQSMFETFYVQTIFNSPIFILKKELLNIPIFGWYLKKIGSISIQRDKITKDNLGFFENISDKISKRVKYQYEINPYPRWRYNSYSEGKKLTIISVINSEIYPNKIEYEKTNIIDKETNI